MAIAVKPKTSMGKLAQARKKEQVKAAPKQPALIFQAMEQLPGYTYPTMGAQLVIYHAQLSLSREQHVGGTKARKLILLLTKKEGK